MAGAGAVTIVEPGEPAIEVASQRLFSALVMALAGTAPATVALEATLRSQPCLVGAIEEQKGPRVAHRADGARRLDVHLAGGGSRTATMRCDEMRERHWKQVMVVCKQTFIMDDKLQLDALLKLQLDKFRDPVGEIVERTRAKIKIDLQLQKTIKTWSDLLLFYKPYKTSGVQVLEQPGDVFEALDDNVVVLQNMMGNRFIGFFETTATSWKAKLAATRSTLDVWLEVSRSRMQLESIFLASEDIGEQLPEDAKRFDAIDAAFREQMTDACQNNDPIEVCMPSGREEVFKKNNPTALAAPQGRRRQARQVGRARYRRPAARGECAAAVQPTARAAVCSATVWSTLADRLWPKEADPEHLRRPPPSVRRGAL
jgi:hypothetical protein